MGALNGKASAGAAVGADVRLARPGTMIPLDGPDLRALIKAALYNIERFNMAAFLDWREMVSEPVRKLAVLRPPDRLWRVITDNEKQGRGCPQIYAVVVGYAGPYRGAPAMVMVHILGVQVGAGSRQEPIPVPEDALIDVTDAAKAGKLAV